MTLPGNFVMGGNFVIGIIVFTILVIVNFVVITKGSGRIAEVAARFNLDAMRGKQMAIDADLSAGLIDENTARTRRKHLEDESAFFGAMDGASKFVRGDAIAGLLIVFINIIGGIIIGVMSHGMDFAEAGRTYTLLTVGDGLVTQIPALIISVAAGLLVTKSGVDGAADKALVKQLVLPCRVGRGVGLRVRDGHSARHADHSVLDVLLLALCAAACTAAARPPAAAPPKAAQPYPAADIVVQGAVDTELQPLLQALEGKAPIQIAAWTFWRGLIGGKTVVVSRTEVGPVNAVAATTLAIVNFRPRLIINQGTAGAAVPDLKLFDIVVGESTVDYGAFRSTHADAGAGVDLSRWTPMPHRLRLDGGERVPFDRFPGDAPAVETALRKYCAWPNRAIWS